MKIAFHDNALSLRGTTVAIYDWAYWTRHYLGVDPIIMYNNKNQFNDTGVIEKFSKEYEIHFLSARNFPEAWDITKQWLDKWGFPYKSINIVRSSIDKVQFVKQYPCDLFIDDFSKGQEYGNSYEVLYTDTINLLNNMGVNLEVFKGDWNEVVKKYIK